jgi:hypothetical protein
MPFPSILQKSSDLAGVAASLLCGVHCVAMAWVLTTTPLVWFTQRLWGIPLSWFSRLELGLAAASLVFALAGLGLGWWRHRHPGPPALGALGLALIATLVVIEWHTARILGPAMVLLGGLLLASAHVWNARLVARRPRTAHPPAPMA